MLLSGKVRDQDIYLAVASLRGSKDGIASLWKWLQEEWVAIYTKFPATSSMIGSIVRSCTSGMTTHEQLDSVNAFFADKNKGGYDRALAQSVDNIKAKIEWVNRDDGDLRAWLGM